MRLVDWLYVAVFAVAAIATIAVWLTVKVPARRHWWRIAAYLAVAAAAAGVTLFVAASTQMRVMGAFIAGMMLIFATWRQGLANWAIVAGLGSVRIWSAITKIELHQQGQWTQLEAFVGSIRVSRLQFKQPVAELRAYIAQHMPATAISEY